MPSAATLWASFAGTEWWTTTPHVHSVYRGDDSVSGWEHLSGDPKTVWRGTTPMLPKWERGDEIRLTSHRLSYIRNGVVIQETHASY